MGGNSSSDVPEVPGITVGRLLGAGRTSKVYAGIDAATGHRVALKLVESDADETRSRPTGFSVGHDNLLRLFRLGRVPDGRTCLVMEHCAGGTLAALLGSRGRLDVGEVVTVLAGVAAGVGALHLEGFVHGDLSPGNVLFTDAGQPVLGDLDVVYRPGEPLAELGTSGFIDPAGESATVDRDVHALGALGWFMLTGSKPGGPCTPLTALRDDVPAPLADLVVRCLGAPERRPGIDAMLGTLAALDVPPERVRLTPSSDAVSATDPGISITARLRSTVVQPQVPAAGARETLRAVRSGAPAGSRAKRPRERTGVGASGAVVGAGRSRQGQPGRRRGGQRTPQSPRGSGRRAASPRRDPGERRWPAKVVPALLILAMIVFAGHRLTATLPRPAEAVGRPTASASPVDADPVEADDPVPALMALNDARAQAISAGDVMALARVNAAGSPALAHDEKIVSVLRAAGVELRGLKVTVLWTTVRESEDDSAAILLSSYTGPHEQVRSSDGQTLARIPAGKVTTTEVRLVRQEGRWYVQEVVAGG